MAVVTTKSGAITNRDATPPVKNSSFVEYGRVRSAVGVVSAVSGDSIASRYVMCQVPSNARIVDVFLDTQTITVGAGDVGLYQTTAAGGAVFDADFFAAATTLVGPINRKTVKQLNTATLGLISNIVKRLWEIGPAGVALTVDPGLMYDVCVTLTTAITTTGPVAVEVTYVVD